MNLLVTGGAGFIGSHFIVDALKKDHTIVAIDNFSTSNKDNLDKIKDASEKISSSLNQIYLIEIN